MNGAGEAVVKLAVERVPECSGIGAQVPGTGARVLRNQCPSAIGMTARVTPEQVPESARNTQQT